MFFCYLCNVMFLNMHVLYPNRWSPIPTDIELSVMRSLFRGPKKHLYFFQVTPGTRTPKEMLHSIRKRLSFLSNHCLPSIRANLRAVFTSRRGWSSNTELRRLAGGLASAVRQSKVKTRHVCIFRYAGGF